MAFGKMGARGGVGDWPAGRRVPAIERLQRAKAVDRVFWESRPATECPQPTSSLCSSNTRGTGHRIEEAGPGLCPRIGLVSTQRLMATMRQKSMQTSVDESVRLSSPACD